MRTPAKTFWSSNVYEFIVLYHDSVRSLDESEYEYPIDGSLHSKTLRSLYDVTVSVINLRVVSFPPQPAVQQMNEYELCPRPNPRGPTASPRLSIPIENNLGNRQRQEASLGSAPGRVDSSPCVSRAVRLMSLVSIIYLRRATVCKTEISPERLPYGARCVLPTGDATLRVRRESSRLPMCESLAVRCRFATAPRV
ncbi:unnamed protein product [Leptosia nina]|uniref:Uncharacterized protein n=1 Tax=Leptosia nina TaxID=320188 RepID=A0AAV1IXN2_9NEOP